MPLKVSKTAWINKKQSVDYSADYFFLLIHKVEEVGGSNNGNQNACRDGASDEEGSCDSICPCHDKGT